MEKVSKFIIFVTDFKQTWIFLTTLLEVSHVKFYGNRPSWIRVVTYGREDGRTDVMRLRVMIRNETRTRATNGHRVERVTF